MVNLNIPLKYFAPWHFFHYLGEKFAYIPSYTRIQDTTAIFRYPDIMILCAINAVSR